MADTPADGDKRKAVARKQAERLADFRRTFQSEPGKKVLLDLFVRYGMGHTQAQDNANQTYFAEGQRSVVLFIIKTLEMNPEKIMEMIASTHHQQD